jgi:hypothetical protein
MSPIAGANPLNYDAVYPQSVDLAVNEDARIFVMERNIGKEIFFQTEDGTQYYGTISSVSNSEHYCVLINTKKLYNGLDFVWEWYVREDKVHFVQDPLLIKDFWQNSEV